MIVLSYNNIKKLITKSIDIDINHIKYVIVFLIVFLLISFIIFVFVSYFIYGILKNSINECNIFFYHYNKKCQRLIDIYGEYKINKIYLVRQPFGKMVTFIFNIISLFNYNKYIKESLDNFPYHSALIFEIKTKEGLKFLLLEKNNCINICETFLINKTYDFKYIPIQKNKFTLKEILNKTQARIGDHKYFNWNIYENNCQEFTKEILITLNKYTDKYKDFIIKDKIIRKYCSPTDFTLHILNCLIIIINFIEKYLLDDTNIFSCLFH